MEQLNLDAGLAAVDNADSLDSAQKDATRRILRAFAGEKEEETYSRGDKFEHTCGTATLSAINGGRVIMTFPDGCYGGPGGGTEVARTTSITEAELVKICGGCRDTYVRKEKVDD